MDTIWPVMKAMIANPLSQELLDPTESQSCFLLMIYVIYCQNILQKTRDYAFFRHMKLEKCYQIINI